MTAPLFTFDAKISFSDPNTVVLSGTASGDFTSANVVANVSNSDLGQPVITNGEWTLSVPLANLPGVTGIVMDVTDSTGATTTFDSKYAILTQISNHPYTVTQNELLGDSHQFINLFDASGKQIYNIDYLNQGGMTTLTEAATAPNASFVFVNATDTAQTITNFHLQTSRRGTNHDTISLPPSAFTSLADVLHNASNSAGNVVIHNPLDSTDTLTLSGVKLGQLRATDFNYHGTGMLV